MKIVAIAVVLVFVTILWLLAHIMYKPIFDKVTIHLDSNYYPGGKFIIETSNNSSQNKYIQSASLNGKMLNKPWFYHDELVKGGTLKVNMGPNPAYDWGAKSSDAPPSMSEE